MRAQVSEEVLLIEDALHVTDNNHQVLLELRGVVTEFLKLADVLVAFTRATHHLEGSPAAHMLLVHGGEIMVFVSLLKTPKVIKQLFTFIDGKDSGTRHVRLVGTIW